VYKFHYLEQFAHYDLLQEELTLNVSLIKWRYHSHLLPLVALTTLHGHRCPMVGLQLARGTL